MKLVCDLTATSRPIRPRSALPPSALRLDFVNDVFTPGGFGSVITFTRASTATHFDATGALQTAAIDTPRIDHDPVTLARRGLLIEAARTNLFLNSAAPATQSIAVTAQSYALSFRGTGSITLSGAHSAALRGTGATAKTVLVFTPAAGTLTLTLSGSVTEPQLEVGNCATSHIVTAGAPVDRSEDRVSVAVGAWWNAAEGTFAVEWQDINAEINNGRIVGLNNSQAVLNLSARVAPNNATGLQAYNGSNALSLAVGSDVTKGTRRAVSAYSAAGRVVGFGGALVTDANPLALTAVTTLFLGHSTGFTQQINGYLRSLTYYPSRLKDAQLLSLL